LFNDALKKSDFTAFNDSCTVNDEMWKKAVVAYFQVLPWHFAEGIKKTRDSIVKAFASGFEPGTSGIRRMRAT
jgi:hypothetical protein